MTYNMFSDVDAIEEARKVANSVNKMSTYRFKALQEFYGIKADNFLIGEDTAEKLEELSEAADAGYFVQVTEAAAKLLRAAGHGDWLDDMDKDMMRIVMSKVPLILKTSAFVEDVTVNRKTPPPMATVSKKGNAFGVTFLLPITGWHGSDFLKVKNAEQYFAADFELWDVVTEETVKAVEAERERVARDKAYADRQQRIREEQKRLFEEHKAANPDEVKWMNEFIMEAVEIVDGPKKDLKVEEVEVVEEVTVAPVIPPMPDREPVVHLPVVEVSTPVVEAPEPVSEPVPVRRTIDKDDAAEVSRQWVNVHDGQTANYNAAARYAGWSSAGVLKEVQGVYGPALFLSLRGVVVEICLLVDKSPAVPVVSGGNDDPVSPVALQTPKVYFWEKWFAVKRVVVCVTEKQAKKLSRELEFSSHWFPQGHEFKDEPGLAFKWRQYKHEYTKDTITVFNDGRIDLNGKCARLLTNDNTCDQNHKQIKHIIQN